MDFLTWNDGIAAHFFRPEHAGRTIYLYVTEDVIEEVGGKGSLDDFVHAMKVGPVWATRQGLCQKALQAMQGWRARALPFPPYIGYLALFVLAAGKEGDFSQHAYYPRLRTILGEEPLTGTYPSFDRMLELWSDLEQWLNHERAGALGILRTDIAGAWLHVGLPTAQAILTEQERDHLRDIFADASLDPEFPPPDLELARIVRAAGGLRPRTLRALENPHSEYGAVLIDRLLEELESWDGTATTAQIGTAAQHGVAIICLPVVDEIAKRVRAELRCRFPEPFPDDVRVQLGGTAYTCSEGADGYSTPFADASGQRLDASRIDWIHSATLRDTGNTASIRWQGATLRVFADGADRGLRGYVEVPSLDPSRRFVVAASPQLVAAVTAWGNQSCSGFRALELSGGPPGWRFFAANRALDDALIREQAPRLSFARDLRRIRLVGGVHVPGLQSYLRFAPPAIRLDGGADDEAIAINGTRVRRDADGSFTIPEEQLAENILVITAGALRRVIFLQDSGTAAGWSLRRYAPDGTATAATPETLACGVDASLSAPYLAPDLLPPVPAGMRVFIVGQRAGELATVANTLTFAPVWLLLQRGRDEYHVTYLATELLEPLPASGSANAPARREWKDLLWRQRKRIAPPGFAPLRRLLQAYQELAADA
jgi:hypothetical protein